MVGAFAFINGLVSLLLLAQASGDRQEKLFEINIFLGSAIVTLSLGGVLVYQAASALGGTCSSAMRIRAPWALVAAFPLLIGLGQFQVNHPDRLPYLFPVVNVAIVSIPSLTVALVVARRYLRFNAFAWPFSWREWTSGFIYGAIGATTVAALINTLYLLSMAALLVNTKGDGDVFPLGDSLPALPRGWGMFFDLSVLSVVAPINEEFWKGMIVAFFFFRRGGAGRCFAWGILAGAGFNLLETFQNSLSAVHPDVVAEQTIGSRWWLFALARTGTGVMHALATGLGALGFYGLFRRQPRFLIGYPCAVLLHGTWNFMAYINAGDSLFSRAAWDSRVLDWMSLAGMVALVLSCAVLAWELPRRVLDAVPAPIYRVLGMVPATSPGYAAGGANVPAAPPAPAAPAPPGVPPADASHGSPPPPLAAP